MEERKLFMARVQVVEAMENGLPWHEAAKRAGLQISQSTAYRLRQRMRKAGEQALREGRHGPPALFAWAVLYCICLPIIGAIRFQRRDL
jgi:transposase